VAQHRAEQGGGVIELRVLTPDDWPVWQALRLRALAEAPHAFNSTLADWQDAGEERWRKVLSVPNSYTLVAVRDAEPVGMARGAPGDEPDVAELYSMWVSPAARGDGVGDRLISAIAGWARGTGARELRLAVKDGNAAAIALYERSGFRRTGWADGEWTMVRPLVQVRPRTDADMDRVVDALRAVYAFDGYPGRWPDDAAGWLRTRDPYAAWVAERGTDVVGHVVLRSAAGRRPAEVWSAATGQDQHSCAVVSRLFVVPAARGTGLGRELMATVVAEARRRGLHPVLDVVDTDVAAIRLYERLGWIRFASYRQSFVDGRPEELLYCYAPPP
jgi:ribosomal protein S18 acetylase RimI-like enzyme